MAKTSGLGAGLFLDEYDLSGDVGSVQSISGKRATLDVTGIDKSAVERILGVGDGVIEFNAFHNPSNAHTALSELPTADVRVTYANGTALGDPTASLVGKQVDYTGSRGTDGSYVHSVSVQGTGVNVEWGVLLTTGKQNYATGTVNGTGVDGGAESTNGGAAYLHVMSMPSGTATFKVQDSADNNTFADVTGLTFTNVTGATSERVATAAGATIRQYVRFQGSGTHGTAAVVCAFVRY